MLLMLEHLRKAVYLCLTPTNIFSLLLFLVSDAVPCRWLVARTVSGLASGCRQIIGNSPLANSILGTFVLPTCCLSLLHDTLS